MSEAALAVVHLDSGALAARVTVPDDVAPAVHALGLHPPRPVIVAVGGAGAMREAELTRLRPLLDEALLPVAVRFAAVVVDGGTRSGVMRALGESLARASTGRVSLVGVAATGTVRVPEMAAASRDAVDLDPHHTHFVLVPGTTWGEESPWLTVVASTIAGPLPSATVVANGGKITLDDVAQSVAARRRVLVVDGSGRAADDLAAALDGSASDPTLRELAGSGLLTIVPVDQPAVLRAALSAALAATEG